MNQIQPDISKAIPVMEQFITLQGEGVYAGHAAYFIRLAGCDVGCVWCDVKESWTASPEQWISYQDLCKSVNEHYIGEITVVTGGEPCIYNLQNLTTQLHSLNKRTHLETSGAYEITGNWDWVTFSPKKFKAPVSSSYDKCDELKVVVYHKSDLEWAQAHANKISKKGVRLLLQPEWSKKEAMTPLIIAYIQEHPEWTLSLQTHKYIGIE